MRIKTAFAWLSVCLALTGCETGHAHAQTSLVKPVSYWPTSTWRTCVPEMQGMNADKLADLFMDIKKKHMPVDGIVITRNGYIVAENYYNDYGVGVVHPVYSVTKSLTSATLGIAMDKGYIHSVKDKVLDYFPGLRVKNQSNLKKQMTIQQFLTMSSGLDWHEESKDLHTNQDFLNQFLDSDDQTLFVLNRPIRKTEMGVFNYSSGEPQVISSIIQNKVGEPEGDFATEKLFTPLGITNVDWPFTHNGTSYGGTAVSMTPRDMAKFGLLYLRQGMWNGKQIVSKKWVDESTSPHVKSSLPGVDYGYYWWVQKLAGHHEYEALGYMGQYIAVVPDLGIVVSLTSQGQDVDTLLQNYIIPSITSSNPIAKHPKADARLAALTNHD